VVRNETVYELFYTTLPSHAFLASDVLHLYLHRGSFETVLSDEDQEQDADRWVSRTPCGQDCWQIISQRVWNLRLELGQHLSPTAMRLTEFSPAQSVEPAAVVEPIAYGPPQWAHRSFTKGFAGSDFVLQPDGTLRCPADHPLTLQERRPERNGSVRMVYGARACHCRPCSLRDQCQESTTTRKPRQVSAVVWPTTSDPFASTAPPPPPLKLHRCCVSLSLLHLLRNPLRSQSCGVIGHAVPSGVAGFSCCAHKPFFFLLRQFRWRRNQPANRQTDTPEHNVRIGV
jgi:hypothetical protein